MTKGQLPGSWEIARLNDIVAINPTIDKRSIDDETLVSFVPMPAIEAETGRIDLSTVKPFKEVKKGYTGFLERDVIFAKITPCMENGKMAIVPKLKNDLGFGSTEFHVLRAPEGISPELLYYYVSSKWFRVEAEHGMTGAVGQRRVPTSFLQSALFPVPPFNEQKRIVAKVEEIFSELDNGIAALKTAREQLKVYRQAVLKHAFEGKLTAQWRKDNADKLESPEQLLARIQLERETRYQQQLEEWKAAVKAWEVGEKEGKKPSKPKEFVMQGEVGAGSELGFDIPDEWKSMLIGHVFSVHVGATPSRKKTEFWNGDIFWVSSGEVAFCEIHKTAETITTEGYENTSTEIHEEGTVLLAMIGEGKTRGQAAILRVPAAHNQNTAAIRVSEVGFPPEYIYYFLQYQYEQTRRVGSGNNQKALNKNRVASIQFPLCSAEEQMAVVQALSEKLSFVENLDNELNVQLAKAEALRQSILKKAFSGQLVPQDPNDEPANDLLVRIQFEREATKVKNTKKTRKAK